MAFTVNLYSFSKRANSTARPSGEGSSFSCIMKEPSGVLSPVIAFNLGVTANPSGYNYAYISAFGRYYYIREWNYENALWYASMVCDVLASYKTEIGNSSLYVLRSASSYDGSICDNMYPMKAVPTHAVTPFDTPWHDAIDTHNSIAYGCYVVGIVSDTPTHGGIAYFAMSALQMSNLCNYLMTGFVSVSNNFDVNDASIALQKNIIDPFDYIRSCTWIPFLAGNIGSSAAYIEIMGINTGCTGIKLDSGKPAVYHNSIPIGSLPRHPQASARGVYLNTSPYTECEIFIPPFGLIPVDTRVLASSPSITCDYRIDCLTGTGILNVEIAGTAVNRVEAQIGVPIQLSQIRQDIIGGATSILSAGASALLGDYIGAAAGIGSAVQAAAPKANTIGGSGGWGDLSGSPGVVQHFYSVADEDLEHNGRPLMQKKTINTLSGYVIVQDGDVAISGTQSEALSIKDFLEGGFFYE